MKSLWRQLIALIKDYEKGSHSAPSDPAGLLQVTSVNHPLYCSHFPSHRDNAKRWECGQLPLHMPIRLGIPSPPSAHSHTREGIAPPAVQDSALSLYPGCRRHLLGSDLAPPDSQCLSGPSLILPLATGSFPSAPVFPILQRINGTLLTLSSSNPVFLLHSR